VSALLDVRNLTVAFGPHAVVRGLGFSLEPGHTLCLVGESGSGKSMTALSILRLVPEPGRIAGGDVRFAGEELLRLDESAMCRIRGRRIAMIFQEPMTSLNPVLRVGEQVAEPLMVHEGVSAREALRRAAELLDTVGMPAAVRRLRDYPHQLSGGMRQRAMIAMALSCKPGLLLADEPTTALDVTIQGQILRLLKKLSREQDMGLLLITHDFGVVAEMADDVGVMYAGMLLERAPAEIFFARTLHPYAEGLKECAPTMDNRNVRRLPVIAGAVPSPAALPVGCSFQPRCTRAFPRCEEMPPLLEAESRHQVRCWLYA
jgi:peptide/nickel transport system ATP-binding protein